MAWSTWRTSITWPPTCRSATPPSIILWEDVWAKPLAEALRDSGGVLIDSARIPADLMEAAFEELAAALKS